MPITRTAITDAYIRAIDGVQGGHASIAASRAIGITDVCGQTNELLRWQADVFGITTGRVQNADDAAHIQAKLIAKSAAI